MKRIEKLSKWNMQTVNVLDGYDQRSVPEPTKENMERLVDKVQELTEMVNILAERQGLIEPEPKDDWS